MKIGVVSDTHSLELPKQMLEDFREVEFIIHAGDFCETATLEKLKKIKDVKAVHGNMDDEKVCKLLPRSQIVQCGQFQIGLFHGEGPPQTLLDVVKKEFKGKKVDAVIFGHSHQPLNEWIDGILYFNPGSPNDNVFAPYQSYGILEVDDKITGKIIKVKK